MVMETDKKKLNHCLTVGPQRLHCRRLRPSMCGSIIELKISTRLQRPQIDQDKLFGQICCRMVQFIIHVTIDNYSWGLIDEISMEIYTYTYLLHLILALEEVGSDGISWKLIMNSRLSQFSDGREILIKMKRQ